MNGLEQTFYIMAIIYMAIMFIVMIAGVIAVFAIKAKVNQLHQMVEEKTRTISSLFHTGEEIVNTVKKVVHRGE
jgi:hypothetical protein